MTNNQLNERGYRGYIVSRPVRTVAYPHRVQNLVIRDYCQRRQLPLYLSATECAIPHSYLMLNDVLNKLDEVDGIVLFSQFVLPPDRNVRAKIYKRILDAGVQLHAAMESCAINELKDVQAFEDILTVTLALSSAPYQGRWPCEDALAFRRSVHQLETIN